LPTPLCPAQNRRGKRPVPLPILNGLATVNAIGKTRRAATGGCGPKNWELLPNGTRFSALIVPVQAAPPLFRAHQESKLNGRAFGAAPPMRSPTVANASPIAVTACQVAATTWS